MLLGTDTLMCFSMVTWDEAGWARLGLVAWRQREAGNLGREARADMPRKEGSFKSTCILHTFSIASADTAGPCAVDSPSGAPFYGDPPPPNLISVDDPYSRTPLTAWDFDALLQGKGKGYAERKEAPPKRVMHLREGGRSLPRHRLAASPNPA